VVRLRDTPDEAREQKKVAAFLLGVGAVGFWFLGLVALLIGSHDPASPGGTELLVAGAVATGIGIFLVVGVFAVWFERNWVGKWHD